MTPYYETNLGELLQTDCRSIPFPDNHFTGVITDPPYELGFMGKKWDSSGVAFQVETWVEILRVCKPGAMLMAFGGTRTSHRLVCAIEDAGWEIRDSMMWIYGSGFPKSLDVSKAIDKEAGVEREVAAQNPLAKQQTGQRGTTSHGDRNSNDTVTAPTTEGAKTWNGYGTALKPAYEPIVIAMKPLDGTFANNALVHGVAGLNIEAGRIGYIENDRLLKGGTYSGNRVSGAGSSMFGTGGKAVKYGQTPKGRWPANIILDEEAGAMLDEQSVERPGCKSPSMAKPVSKFRRGQGNYMPQGQIHSDTGGASRFFYTAKASRSERGKDNDHPTVKPVALIRYLVELTAPPKDALILDPFIGSGTLGVVCEKLGIKYVGIDLDCSIAAKRIERETSQQRLPGGF